MSPPTLCPLAPLPGVGPPLLAQHSHRRMHRARVCHVHSTPPSGHSKIISLPASCIQPHLHITTGMCVWSAGACVPCAHICPPPHPATTHPGPAPITPSPHHPIHPIHPIHPSPHHFTTRLSHAQRVLPWLAGWLAAWLAACMPACLARSHRQICRPWPPPRPAPTHCTHMPTHPAPAPIAHHRTTAPPADLSTMAKAQGLGDVGAALQVRTGTRSSAVDTLADKRHGRGGRQRENGVERE